MPNQANAIHPKSHPIPCSLGQIQATLGVNDLQDIGRRYKVKSAARQTSNGVRTGLVFCRCGAAFVSLREGSAGSWLVSSRGSNVLSTLSFTSKTRSCTPIVFTQLFDGRTKTLSFRHVFLPFSAMVEEM